MKKHVLRQLISIPLVVSTSFIPLVACNNGQKPTRVYKITLDAGDHGKLNRTWVEVDAGATWGPTEDRIEKTPDDGYAFDHFVDEQGETITKNTIINSAFTAKAVWKHATFQDDSWSHICKLNNEGGLAALKSFYGVNTFVGLRRKLAIENLVYNVRVIGEEHDTIFGSANKAVLTFESEELYRLTSKWGSTVKEDYAYHNSVLRKNLDGKGSAESIWDHNIFELISAKNPELGQSIKTVDKKWVSGLTPTTMMTYRAQVFALTRAEMNDPSIIPSPEGTVYSYYSDCSPAMRIKKNTKGVATPYHLTSVNSSAEKPYYIDSWGAVKYDLDPTENTGVAFAFCI